MRHYFRVISIFIACLIFIVITSGKAWSQELPDSGNQAGEVFIKYDADFLGNLKTGVLKAVTCGANYRRYSKCHELIPANASSLKKCFISNENVVVRFDHDLPLIEQTIYYGTRISPYGEFIYFWHDNDFIRPKNKEEWFMVHGSGALIDCSEPLKSKSNLESVVSYFKKFDLGTYGVENCLLAERGLRNDALTYSYNRVRFFCFPQPSLAHASNLLTRYVELAKGDGYSVFPIDNKINGKYYTIMFNKDAILAPNICHARVRATVIDADKSAEFYRLNSATPEIPDGQAVLAFALEERDCEAKSDKANE